MASIATGLAATATPPPDAAPPAPPPIGGHEHVSLDKTVAQAHVIQLRLMFATWQTHFRSLGYVKDSTMQMMDKVVCWEVVQKSVKDATIRYVGSFPSFVLVTRAVQDQN